MCIACGHCVAVCPTAAIEMEWLNPGHCPPIEKQYKLTPVQAEQFLRSRRSVRNYRGKTVERAKFEKLLEIAGQRVGIGSYRPDAIRKRNPVGPFGTFSASVEKID